MNQRSIALTMLVVGTAACNQQEQPEKDANFVTLVAKPGSPAPKAAPAPPPHPPLPAFDPKSGTAAVALVQGFADLLNTRKFDEAYMLLGPGAPPRGDFGQRFARYSKLNVTVGSPGAEEGAAGSIYLSVPLHISATLGGKDENRDATAILRRVNDVPGSTEAQRRWHIERIEWGSGG